MTTRTIVTSQPDVACDVCARRLLRGEQPDVFIADGQRRTGVRAVRAAGRPRGLAARDRGRGRRSRCRRCARGAGAACSTACSAPRAAPRGRAERRGTRREPPREAAPARRTTCFAAAAPAERRSPRAPGEQAVAEAPPARRRTSSRRVDVVQRERVPAPRGGRGALAGAPVVSVRSAEHLESVVRIVVAWELCWYRYEVDLGEEPLVRAGARAGHRARQLQPRGAPRQRARGAAAARSLRRSRNSRCAPCVLRAAPVTSAGAMIYCVVPKALADELYPKLVEHYSDDENVTVIVERREFDRRARSGRSSAVAPRRRAPRDPRPPPRARRRRHAAARQGRLAATGRRHVAAAAA